jgi:hypothetical protein
MFKNLLKNLLITVSVIATVGISIPTRAATFTEISIESSQYGVDLYAVCKQVFDWEKFIQSKANTTQPISPWTAQTCLPRPVTGNLVKNVAAVSNQAPVITNYGQYFQQVPAASAEIKTLFGNDPILGIYPNGKYTAGGIVDKATQQINPAFDNVDRSKLTALPTIFSPAELKEVFATTNGSYTTGMPKFYHTGADNYNAEKTNYNGGWCEVVNGKLKVRAKRLTTDADPANDETVSDAEFAASGINPADPASSCAVDAPQYGIMKTDKVPDRNLQAYLFVYEYNYPTTDQCLRLSNYGFDTNSEAKCKSYFQGLFGKKLAGDTDMNSGTKIQAVYPYYAALFNDKFDKAVGWNNPYIGNRSTATDEFIKSFDGWAIFEL